ncbi:phosphohydrolase [Candidatus Campbellbacteria bacterium CG22_combo_CG10-13_8_21_14_all_36_13]|uniref:5'-deoxynucleotidase n=1 Tax=Candidatus Campbellbacteria bacterium CG22_combo_CG10-13_8_21_14_all_36_13 TaxID=1974529 RepID=A0A2H0DXJ5_9BACT|nr:MAG: phosphohydrolase [Candidatus Campbellbacteria bacterium CG22_combo_CG10-13_8_21_14_all_36_13]
MENNNSRIAQFLFEVGTMRKVARMHRQVLFTYDMSDNIATHTFRVAIIGFFLAKLAGADWKTVVMMCLLHDMGEARTNDHNWVHKRYVSEDSDKVLDEQLGSLPFSDLFDIATEYEKRESLEAILAKDADSLDQLLLLREYAWQGNREAQIWLDGKTTPRPYAQLDRLKTDWAKDLGRAIYEENPSSWWDNLHTNVRRSF